MKRFIYVFNEETKKELLSKGFRLVKDSKPFIFANNSEANFSDIENKEFCFSDTMQF